MKRLPGTLLECCMMGMALFAQANLAYISGFIVSKKNHHPLAHVRIALSSQNHFKWHEISDRKGVFSFMNIPAGIYTLHFAYSGYKNLDAYGLQVDAGEQIQLPVIHLHPGSGVNRISLSNQISSVAAMGLAGQESIRVIGPKASIRKANALVRTGNKLASRNQLLPAAQAFEKAAKLYPARAPIAYYDEGVAWSNHSQYAQAVNSFKKCLLLQPKNQGAWFLMGMNLANQANYNPTTHKLVILPGTLSALKKYLELAPQGRHAAMAQGMLKSLSGPHN